MTFTYNNTETNLPPSRIAVSHQCSSQLLAARISSCSEAVRSPASPERHSTPTSTSLWRPQRRRQWQTPAAASFASVILENLSGLRHCSSTSSPSDEKTQVWNELAFYQPTFSQHDMQCVSEYDKVQVAVSRIHLKHHSNVSLSVAQTRCN